MLKFIQCAKSRHFSMSNGFGVPITGPWVRWLWLDALLFAIHRFYVIWSPGFRAWRKEVDVLFCEQFDSGRSMTEYTGVEHWIDAYLDGMSPQDTVDNEVSYWDC